MLKAVVVSVPLCFFLFSVGKSKRARKKKKDCNSLDDLEKRVEAVQSEPCHLSSVDESCSREITSMILSRFHIVVATSALCFLYNKDC